MAEGGEPASPVGPPALAEAGGWVGFELDDADGVPLGRVHGVFVDQASGQPAWLIASVERRSLLPWRRSSLRVAVPARDCAGAAGRVWTAHDRAQVMIAPAVDPRRPLLREHELVICAHYGIGERVGRAAEVVGRPQGAVTSEPA